MPCALRAVSPTPAYAALTPEAGSVGPWLSELGSKRPWLEPDSHDTLCLATESTMPSWCERDTRPKRPRYSIPLSVDEDILSARIGDQSTGSRSPILKHGLLFSDEEPFKRRCVTLPDLVAPDQAAELEVVEVDGEETHERAARLATDDDDDDVEEVEIHRRNGSLFETDLSTCTDIVLHDNLNIWGCIQDAFMSGGIFWSLPTFEYGKGPILRLSRRRPVESANQQLPGLVVFKRRRCSANQLEDKPTLTLDVALDDEPVIPGLVVFKDGMGNNASGSKRPDRSSPEPEWLKKLAGSLPTQINFVADEQAEAVPMVA